MHGGVGQSSHSHAPDREVRLHRLVPDDRQGESDHRLIDQLRACIRAVLEPNPPSVLSEPTRADSLVARAEGIGFDDEPGIVLDAGRCARIERVATHSR